MRLQSLLFAPLFVIVGFSQAAADSWVQVGPLARDTRSAAIHPSDPSLIYATVNMEGPVLFQTRDGGSAWSPVPAPGSAVVFDPNNPDVCYAYGSKLQKSIDGGMTWAEISSFYTLSLAIDPANSNRIFAGTFGPTGANNVCRSVDGGASWTCSALESWFGSGVSAIVVDPGNGDVVYAATAGDFDNPGRGIFKSTDAGATWTNISTTSFYAEVSCLVMNPSDPDVLLAGTTFGGFAPQGILKSVDAGATWTQSSTGLPDYIGVYDMAIDPLQPDIVYVATSDGFYRSVNEGADWTRMSSAPGFVNTVDLCASMPNVMCLATGGGVFVSNDTGATFTQLGAPPSDMMSIVVDQGNGNVLYATGRGTFKSLNRGASWSDLSFVSLGTVIRQDPNNRQVLYLGNFYFGPTTPNSWIQKTSNGGSTWPVVLRDVAVNDIVVARSNSAVVYAGGFAKRDVGGVFKSADAGAHWTTMAGIPTNSIAVHPGNAAVVYLGGDTGLFKSIDGGATWLPIQNGLDQPSSGHVLEVQIDPGQPQTVYCGTSIQGVFKSLDGGINWTHLTSPLTDCRAIAIDPIDTHVVYASSWRGVVCVTVDGGEQWQQLGTAMVGGENLVLDPTDRDVLYSALDGIWGYERTSQCAMPVIASHLPDVVDLSQCDTGCALTFGVQTADDYSQVAVVALEHMTGSTWIQVDQIAAPLPVSEWQLEYHVDGSETPGQHLFRCVARGVDGSRAASAAVEVTFSVGPVPTFFSSIESAYVDGSVRIRWSTEGTADAQGFNVCRKRAGSEFRRLNEELIAARGDYELVDSDVEARVTYAYQVEAVTESGAWLSPMTSVSIPAFTLQLVQNRPNPFNPSTTISFEMPVASTARLEIYDVSGHLVATVLNRPIRAGRNDAKWDGRDFAGRPASSGVYFYRLTALGQVLTKRMVLLK
jgi:photosystem II stability/assembly factor-like uncharacterized protein